MLMTVPVPVPPVDSFVRVETSGLSLGGSIEPNLSRTDRSVTLRRAMN